MRLLASNKQSKINTTVPGFQDGFRDQSKIFNGTDAYAAVLVASAGNWFGGMSSYAIG
jgi:hypothetical protein